MALFGKKKKEEKKDAPAPVTAAKSAVASIPSDSAHVLLNPRITEKATMHSSESVYTFHVAESANKYQIAQAVRELYKVTPRMVRVVRIPSKIKRNMRTGKEGVKKGGKKAYVYLKRGETITMNQGV